MWSKCARWIVAVWQEVLPLVHALASRMSGLARKEDGMSTVEYAIGTIAAAAFGALLYTVVTGGSVASFLTKIIEKALSTSA